MTSSQAAETGESRCRKRLPGWLLASAVAVEGRRRIWLAAREQRFGSLEELNAWLGERCKALWAELRHPEHKAFSVAEMLELERSHLMPKPVDLDGLRDILAGIGPWPRPSFSG